MAQPDDRAGSDKIKYYNNPPYAMLAFKKLAGNARRFKMLTGMSLQEFEFLLAKVERAYPEEERKRLSKRPRQRGIEAGRRFSLNLRDLVLLLLFYSADRKFLQSVPLASITFVSNMDTSH